MRKRKQTHPLAETSAALLVFLVNIFVGFYWLWAISWGEVSNFAQRGDMQTFDRCFYAAIVTAITVSILSAVLGAASSIYFNQTKKLPVLISFIVSTGIFILTGSFFNFLAIYLVFSLTNHLRIIS